MIAAPALNASDKDKGHRYGNFHNYYQFHPAANRTKFLGGMLDYIANGWTAKSYATTFRLSDIGCNEGDLTLELARLLAQRLAHTRTPAAGENPIDSTALPSIVEVTGMDLDPLLIGRAMQKSQGHAVSPLIQATFRAIDILKDGIPNAMPGLYTADLTTIFSTTMWIHIHGGDEGLRRVMRDVCESTRFWILLEPQPSKCYGTASTRLRRQGLDPVDVSNERLLLRANVEDAIKDILSLHRFEQVVVSDRSFAVDDGRVNQKQTKSVSEGGFSVKTSWNRSLRLYKRVDASYFNKTLVNRSHS